MEPKQIKHPKKQEYYRRKRKERLAYQNEYYAARKEFRKRQLERLEILDPEEFANRKNQISDYNRRYYRSKVKPQKHAENV